LIQAQQEEEVFRRHPVFDQPAVAALQSGCIQDPWSLTPSPRVRGEGAEGG